MRAPRPLGSESVFEFGPEFQLSGLRVLEGAEWATKRLGFFFSMLRFGGLGFEASRAQKAYGLAWTFKSGYGVQSPGTP